MTTGQEHFEPTPFGSEIVVSARVATYGRIMAEAMNHAIDCIDPDCPRCAQRRAQNEAHEQEIRSRIADVRSALRALSPDAEALLDEYLDLTYEAREYGYE